MQHAYVVTGTLTDARTVTLDEDVQLPSARVRLVVEPLGSVNGGSYREIMAAIRERQQARGHRPPTREEVDAYIRSERDSWPE
jgi:hypothetical protein